MVESVWGKILGVAKLQGVMTVIVGHHPEITAGLRTFIEFYHLIIRNITVNLQDYSYNFNRAKFKSPHKK